jgi:drug/metabolite transporter (DMT)-like permease
MRTAVVAVVRFALLAVIGFLLVAVLVGIATNTTGLAEKAVILALGVALALAASRVRHLGEPHPH